MDHAAAGGIRPATIRYAGLPGPGFAADCRGRPGSTARNCRARPGVSAWPGNRSQWQRRSISGYRDRAAAAAAFKLVAAKPRHNSLCHSGWHWRHLPGRASDIMMTRDRARLILMMSPLALANRHPGPAPRAHRQLSVTTPAELLRVLPNQVVLVLPVGGCLTLSHS